MRVVRTFCLIECHKGCLADEYFVVFCQFSGSAMKYLAAYLLSTMGGNKSPTAKDIENVLGMQFLFFFQVSFLFCFFVQLVSLAC